jgi:hypothetical protein
MDESDRYLNLATINLGEAMTTLGNVRQQGHPAGDTAYNRVKFKLTLAVFALEGRPYEPPPDVKDLPPPTVAAVLG